MKNLPAIKIGLTSVIGIALLIWGVNFLKGRDLFNRKNAFYVEYIQVNGLTETNPVTVNGMKVGQVKDISIKKDGSHHLIVKFFISNDINIPKNSVARIYSADLMGSKSIEILLGNSPKLAEDGDTLKADIQSTLQEEVNMQILPLKQKAESLISSIDSLITTIQVILNKNMRDNLENSFESIKHTINNLEHITFKVDTLLSSEQFRIARILQNVESITFNLKNNNDKIKNIITNFSMISDSLAKANVAHSLQNADKALSDLSMIMNKINKGDGTMGALVNNDSLYNNLESATKNLNELIDDIKLNPHRYIHISVFGRNPKKNPYEKPAANSGNK